MSAVNTSVMKLIGEDTLKDLMYRAYEVALQSPDPSTQNGAILYHIRKKIILAEACNTFPDGVEHTEERWTNKDWKYPLVDHAESNVLFTAFRDGVFHDNNIFEMTMICPWAACPTCAKVITGFGLRSVITHKQGISVNHGQWADSIDKAKVVMAECNRKVCYELYDAEFGNITLRRNGGEYTP